MAKPVNRGVNRAYRFFVDDRNVYQESHSLLKEINQIIVQARFDICACYGISKCTGRNIY